MVHPQQAQCSPELSVSIGPGATGKVLRGGAQALGAGGPPLGWSPRTGGHMLSAATCRLGAAHTTTAHWPLGSKAGGNKADVGNDVWTGSVHLALKYSPGQLRARGRRRGTRRGREAGAVGGRRWGSFKAGPPWLGPSPPQKARPDVGFLFLAPRGGVPSLPRPGPRRHGPSRWGESAPACRSGDGLPAWSLGLKQGCPWGGSSHVPPSLRVPGLSPRTARAGKGQPVGRAGRTACPGRGQGV